MVDYIKDLYNKWMVCLGGMGSTESGLKKEEQFLGNQEKAITNGNFINVSNSNTGGNVNPEDDVDCDANSKIINSPFNSSKSIIPQAITSINTQGNSLMAGLKQSTRGSIPNDKSGPGLDTPSNNLNDLQLEELT